MVDDRSQRQMVMKERQERNKHLNRAVYNEWGLYAFVQMVCYKCVLYGKDFVILDEAILPRPVVAASTSKPCHCGREPIAVVTLHVAW